MRRYLYYPIFTFLLLSQPQQAQFGSTDFPHPQSISYEGVPGYNKNDAIPCLEWSTTNDKAAISASLDPPEGLRIRWLGTAGYEISDDSVTILIDPFVSRPKPHKLFPVLHVDEEAVNRYVLNPLDTDRLKLILISHNHYDHSMDLSYILSRFSNPGTRPLVFGDPNVAKLILSHTDKVDIPWLKESGGLEDTRISVFNLTPKESNGEDAPSEYVGRFGEFEVWAFKSIHPAYHPIPWRGPDGVVEKSPPYSALGYKTYHNVSIEYLITYRGLKIFFTESPTVLYPEKVGKVQILLQGIASRKNEHTIPQTLAYLQPEFIIPTHYDNFFKPLREFQQFDYHIGLPFAEEIIDFSRFEEFLAEFPALVQEAQAISSYKTEDSPSQIRLLKLFYYYSIESLIPK